MPVPTGAGPDPIEPALAIHALAAVVAREAEAPRRLLRELPATALPAEIQKLLLQPHGRQLTILRNRTRLRTLPNAELLLEHSFEARFSSADLGLLCSSLALTMIAELDPAPCESALRTDLAARAAAHAGNSLRLLANLEAADSILDHARRLARAGTGDPLLETTILSFAASLRSYQGRSEEAIALLQGILRARLLASDLHYAGRTLVSLGVVYARCTDFRSALVSGCRALRLLDSSCDPVLFAGCVYNVAAWSLEAGLLDQARAARRLFDRVVPWNYGPLNWLRVQWLDALVAARSGDLAEAVEQFIEVREAWRAAHMPWEFAVATIDLAELLLATGRTQEIAPLAAELLPLLSQEDCWREALAAVTRLESAARTDRLSRSLVRGVARTVRRSASSALAR